MTRNRHVPSLPQAEVAFARSLVMHEDNSLIAFNKPPGLAVQAGSGIARSLDDLMAAFAKSNGKRPRLVHRLDQGTSGVIIAAKTQPVAAKLSEAFAGRDVQKTYLALVKGRVPEADEGVIDAPLVKVEESGKARMIVAKPDRKGAQAARTGWRV
ncbi:MAG TPA: pseudouridine synthase, partial [Hyphomonas sp.]|nr:pseudouridine synthase [Hyphomonas sp.]